MSEETRDAVVRRAVEDCIRAARLIEEGQMPIDEIEKQVSVLSPDDLRELADALGRHSTKKR